MIKWQKHKEFGTGVFPGPAGHPELWITLWITWVKWSLEFGSLNERTYRYDYHASLLGGISLGKPF